MKTALLIIDIQNDYFPNGNMELEGSIQAASAAARLLAQFRKEHWPVYHVQHISTRPGNTFLLPDTRGSEIHNYVKPLPGETVIIKHYPNSFKETELHERLTAEGIGTLLVCGMMSHMCVDATVRAAFDLGLNIILAHDACATKELSFNGVTVPAKYAHASFMSALGSVYARAMAVDDILKNIVAEE